jgi:hypothetical protein
MFSIEESLFKGYPVINILENGKPFYEDNDKKRIKDYSFGIKKSIVIISNIQLIKQFVESNGNNIESNIEFDFSNDKYCLSGTYIKYDDFLRSDGININKPYLQFMSSANIAFGLHKAQAFLELQSDIERFIQKHKKEVKCVKSEPINFIYNNKSYKYIGDVEYNKADGFGTVYFSRYETFEGEFKKGFMHGHGILTKYNEQFIGEWVANMRHGKFIRITPPDIEREEFWENDQKVPKLTGAKPFLNKDSIDYYDLK